ncbi:MAG: hypothetical protein HC786_31045, partial [Richelia sp. CSU_2_1]|nr:hypothetical protein [Richelia sp. CSU_2_1]
RRTIQFITGMNQPDLVLALNAAVEAVRARENGRGFAVIKQVILFFADFPDDRPTYSDE